MRAGLTEDPNVIIRYALGLAAVILAFGAIADNLSDAQRAEIEERLKPVGEVCLQGDSSCGGAAATASAGPRSGEDVYNSACMACHTTGAGGAPIYGDAAAWADRIAKGTEALYASGVNGVPGTGMIAKGGCMSCSDEEIHAAVDYIVAGSQ
ncbi:cytochrome c5 family protein [Seongchinamella sediminis]|uniref:Cytochrome c5 family protein n=1 Tax=Seongchinamella sediminis TaxID=2283635 RepID=A0A3L7DTW2_9GAMM|nr:c-type cytochrome [Seongchinamella sediminis]RLQ21008.1 cytochrome c5 family protein [Seongchinamella sediminis]